MTGDPGEMSGKFDEWFSVLADRECRYVLYYFSESDTSVASVAELAEHIGDHDDYHRSDSDRLELSLYHAKLPKLAEADVVEYDARSKTVRYHGHPILEEWVGQTAETECRVL
ncbi:DUF7344 domain-containing protein [Halorussus halophilus]|uniref:DUF7344 domain-containing protein n=1 Tax=Halorussus halophilus TaxID=2650975 RepID=UPI001300E00C|nr:hypothetical protein [Halorussus halophilus]